MTKDSKLSTQDSELKIPNSKLPTQDSQLRTPNSELQTPDSKRCQWCGQDPLYVKYHDEEWGKEIHDDRVLFEFMVLESAQAGLSWITVLRKRENYRKAFEEFDPLKVAEFTEEDLERLLQDAGIIRNRQKINAAINNARHFLEIQKEFGSFDRYMYSFMPDAKPIVNGRMGMSDIPPRTEIS